MTYEKILEKAEKKPLSVKQFDEFFKPFIKDDQTMLFDFPEEATYQANSYAHKQGTKTYQHIWTCVDGDNGKLILINGWHLCNRIAYVVCETPWGDGSDQDSDIYIEARYQQ